MEKDSLLRKPLFIRICIIILICMAETAYGSVLIYKWKLTGELISSENASSNILGILAQNLVISIVTFLIFLCFFAVLKKDFADEMFLRLKNRFQKVTVTALIVVLIGITVFIGVRRTDWITAIHNLFYYVFIIAFAEEFICRGCCVYLLKNEKTAIRYLVPNMLFSLAHIFNYSGYEKLTAEYILHFLRSDAIILIAVGCFFQYLKEKTGTLWVGVLVHAVWDIILP